MLKMDFAAAQGQQFEFVIADPLETEPLVKNAPFSAEAVNEFIRCSRTETESSGGSRRRSGATARDALDANSRSRSWAP